MLPGALTARAEKIREHSLRQKLYGEKEAITSSIGPFLSKRIQEQPENSTQNTKWSVEDQALINKITLYISERTVTKNDKFYADLLQEIALGPDSPRAQTRELQNGLIMMLFLINQTATTLKVTDHCVTTTDIAWSAREQSLINWLGEASNRCPWADFVCLHAPQCNALRSSMHN